MRAAAVVDTGSTGARTAQQSPRGYYDALNDGPSRSALPSSVYSTVLRILSNDRHRIGCVGEWLYENDGLVGYAVDQISNYSVPIVPQAATQDTEANPVVDKFFADWARVGDYTGRADFWTLQAIAQKMAKKRGDAGALMVMESGFPQIRLYKATDIGNPKDLSNKEKAEGVIKQRGKVVGYWIRLNPDDKELTAVPASQFFLIRSSFDDIDEDRGKTPIRRGANDKRDARDIAGFEKQATKLAAAMGAYITNGTGYEDDHLWSDGDKSIEEGGSAAPADASEHEKGISLADIYGGEMPILSDGGKIELLKNERPGPLVIELIEYLGGCFIQGLGFPSAFFLDQKLTGPNQRSVNGKAQRAIDAEQSKMAQFVSWVYVRVVGWGIATGQIPAPAGALDHEWQGPPDVSIDEGRDAQQWREDLKHGLMTRQSHFAKRALNWRRETDQGFAEDEYIITKANQIAADKQIPVSWVLYRWGYLPAPVVPTATETTTEKKDEDSTETPN